MSSTCGTVIGRSRVIECDRIIYVPGAAYDALPVSQKYQTARTIGKIMKKTAAGEKVVLIGPGRWGTTTVFLGIPVTFAEISRAECILEVVEMGDNFIPDVSLGTHFFNDLVELDILYLAHYPQKEGTVSCLDRLLEIPNALPSILDDAESLGLAEVIRVIECAPAAVGPDRIGPAKIGLAADIVSQTWALRLT